MSEIKRKLIGLIHWWIELEPKEHRHWCLIGNGIPERCEHQHSAWHCYGAFCINQERKNCPRCESGSACPPIPYSQRSYLSRCECGLGGE